MERLTTKAMLITFNINQKENKRSQTFTNIPSKTFKMAVVKMIH